MVMGGTGYMTSWIVKMLMEEGNNVNAQFRKILSNHRVLSQLPNYPLGDI